VIALGLYSGQPVERIQTISYQQNIPRRFLEQMLNKLKSGGFVRCKHRTADGYRITRMPETITVASIVSREGFYPNCSIHKYSYRDY